MKLLQIIEQINFNTFEGMVRIIHDGGVAQLPIDNLEVTNTYQSFV